MGNPIAIVIGLCPHGLAISRSLNRSGIKVIALEANRSLAGTRTNCADVVFVEDINGPGLIESLVLMAPSFSVSGPPVLFLTNDTMIATVGKHYGRIESLYELSWGPSRSSVLPLLRKEMIERHCKDAGIPHPKSLMINTQADMASDQFDLQFPVIFKPDRPVSAFKTLVVGSRNEIGGSWPTIEQCLPAIAQEFIPGDDSRIKFAAIYLDHGAVVARFEGRKIRSRPMGHTSIAVSESDDEMHELAQEFFAGLDMSGPVSLEVKIGPENKYWVIEPTVGRTDFWVGLCIEDRIDFPMIEYLNMIGKSQSAPPQDNRTLWINGERDPGAILWLAAKLPLNLIRFRIVGVFINSGDLRPFFTWASNYARQLPLRAFRKIRKLFVLFVRRTN